MRNIRRCIVCKPLVILPLHSKLIWYRNLSKNTGLAVVLIIVHLSQTASVRAWLRAFTVVVLARHRHRVFVVALLHFCYILQLNRIRKPYLVLALALNH